MPPIGRILDANANRAREALRVMEDAARFLLDDADLSSAIKQARHTLAALLPDTLAHRDTPGDVGTSITTQQEASRASAHAVAAAAGKRLSEALRAIEEFGKTHPGVDAAAIEQLRYTGYELERRLLTQLGTGRAQQWALCLLLTQSLCKLPWQEVLTGAIAGGADCVQVREKDLDAGPLLKHVQQVLAIAQPRGVPVIVNDRPDVALAAGAQGVHLGQTDLPVPAVRQLVGTQLLIGVSTSNLDEAQAAARDGADYCGVGPMFSTTTKHKPTLAGPAYLDAYRAKIQRPHLAIGGITPDNRAQLHAQGVAVSSALCAADDPQSVAKALCASTPATA